MSNHFRWRAGAVPVAVSERGLLALDDDPQMLESLWELLEAEANLGELLQALAAHRDNDVFSLPDFLFAVFDGAQLNMAARGRFEISLHSTDGETEKFSAPQVIVWDEAHFSHVHSFVLTLSPEKRAGRSRALPVRSAIVSAQEISWGGVSDDVPEIVRETTSEKDFSATLLPEELEESHAAPFPAPPEATSAEEAAFSTPPNTFEEEAVPVAIPNTEKVAPDWLHDGETMTPEQLRAARTAAELDATVQAETSAQGKDEQSGTTVLAVFCEGGHPNPTHASACRSCGGPIGNETGRVPRPVLGVLRSSTGEYAPLDADIVIGRLPQGTSEPGAPSPHLMAVSSPSKAISKSHCAVRVSDWDITVEDLGSTNGTFLIRGGASPRRVSQNQHVFLRTGDVLDLGDGVVLTVSGE